MLMYSEDIVIRECFNTHLRIEQFTFSANKEPAFVSLFQDNDRMLYEEL